MKKILYAIAFTGCLLTGVQNAFCGKSTGISIAEKTAPPEPALDITIPRGETGGDSWRKGKPVWEERFTQETDGELKELDRTARGWFAVSKTGLLVYAIVNDPAHKNPHDKQHIWRGDCFYLGIDALGDGESKPRDSEWTAPDDASFILALTDHGIRMMPETANPADFHAKVIHDEKKKQTAYSMVVPWGELGVHDGQSPVIGLSVVVADTSDGNPPHANLHWGESANYPQKPWLFNRLKVAPPKYSFTAISPVQLGIYGPGDEVVVAVAAAGKEKITIEANIGTTLAKETFVCREGINRFEVRLDGKLPAEKIGELEVTVASEGKALIQKFFSARRPDLIKERLVKRLEALNTGDLHPLARRHLESSQRLVEQAFMNLGPASRDNPGLPRRFAGLCQSMLDHLPETAFPWRDYTYLAKPLVLDFVSKADSTLQFYWLQLPYDWNPDNTYPLVVHLHGAGDEYPLSYVNGAFIDFQDTLFNRDEMDPANLPPAAAAYVLSPHARGNQGYAGLAEEDVWQCLKEVLNSFKIDRDRQYLIGFSMGSHGTYALASRRPQQWAAVVCASGFGDWTDMSLPWLEENLRNRPLRAWIGSHDRMLDAAKKFHQFMQEHGHKMDLIIAPNLPHTFPYKNFQENAGWMMQHRRKDDRKAFNYVCDTEMHPGRNGVYARYHDAEYPQPRFSVKTAGQTVEITFEGTAGFSVSPGKKGLGLEGDIVILWNGKEAYHGPVTEEPLKLGEGAGNLRNAVSHSLGEPVY